MRKGIITFIVLVLMLSLQGMTYAGAAEKVPLNSSDIVLRSGWTYTISNERELYNFAAIVNEGTGQIGRGARVELTGDITVNEEEWIPIGATGGEFRGTFDGKGYTISGLYCTDSNDAGLFGMVLSPASIQNVNVRDSLFRGNYAGGICGFNAGAQIENCGSSAVIYGEQFGGGIAGTNFSSGTIKNCTNSGPVYGGQMAGSICGWNHAVKSENCVNEGTSEGKYFSGCMDGNEQIPEGYVLLDMEPDVENQHNQPLTKGYTFYIDAEATEAAGTRCQYVPGEGYLYVPTDGTLLFQLDTDYGYEVMDVYGNDVLAEQRGQYYAVTFMPDPQGPANIKIRIEEKKIAYAVNIINETRGMVEELVHDQIRITPKEGSYIEKVLHNGVNIGAATTVQVDNMDIVEVYFAKIGETWGETVVNDKKGRPEEQILTEEQKPRVIKGVQNTTIKAQTVKVSGSLIRVCWEKSPGYRVDYFQVFRSTKRNSGYGTKAFYTTKTGKASYYTNSKSLKKGTRYYYKVRGVRVIDGKKYYTKWSNKAYRTAGTW